MSAVIENYVTARHFVELADLRCPHLECGGLPPLCNAESESLKREHAPALQKVVWPDTRY